MTAATQADRERQEALATVPPATAPARVPAWLMWTFGLMVLLIYFGLLGHFGLAEPDEPRYAEIAREMIELGDWVTPHLNYVKYFEKPPLIYWLTAANAALFGTSAFVLRLWPAVFACVGIVTAYALGCAMYGEWVGAVAAALLAATPLYFGLGQILILDMPLSALMGFGLAAFWFAYTRAERGCFVLALYVATALGVLTKGPVAALLTGAVIAAFLLSQRDRRALRWLISPLGIGLFCLIAVPWHVLVSYRNPEFIEFFVIKQHLARFLTPDEHREPLWFFVPIVFGGMLPWSLCLLCAPGRLREFLGWRRLRSLSPAAWYCLSWSGVVFVFFSLSGSKLGTYVLPLFCPLAILAARFLQRVVAERQADMFVRVCYALLVFAGGCVVGAAITARLVHAWQVDIVVPRMYLGAIVLGAAALASLRLARRRAVWESFVVLLFGMLLLQAVAISGRGAAEEYRDLGEVIRRQARPEDAVISYRHYVQALAFYGRRRIIMASGRGELSFGSRQGDQRAFFWDTDEQLIQAWHSDRHVFLVINWYELDSLRPRLDPPPRQIAVHHKKRIVVNFNDHD
jgi:4-amino-4-deoxy-L-arabinose transferase-like glycosyltransferase